MSQEEATVTVNLFGQIIFFKLIILQCYNFTYLHLHVLFECNIPPVHIIRDYLLLRTAYKYSQLPPNHTAKNLFYSDYLEQKTKIYDRNHLPRNYNYRSIAFEVLELEDVDRLLHGYTQNSGKLCWKPIHHATTNKTQLYEKMKTLCRTERETKCKSLRKIKTNLQLYYIKYMIHQQQVNYEQDYD
jgi:hypothetical protein